jgi:hypothetical protein
VCGYHGGTPRGVVPLGLVVNYVMLALVMIQADYIGALIFNNLHVIILLV